MQGHKKETELIDYLEVIWKRKWFIVIPSLILVIFAGFLSLRQPTPYEVSAIIQPSQISQISGGRLYQATTIGPQDLAVQINQASFNNQIASALNLNPSEIPIVTAENLQPQNTRIRANYLTNLIRLSIITYQDTDRAKKVLISLFEIISEQLDKEINSEVENINAKISGFRSQIKSLEIEIKENGNQTSLKHLLIKDKDNEIKIEENEIKKLLSEIKNQELAIVSTRIENDRIKNDIASDLNKIKISEEHIKGLTAEMKEAKERIDELDRLQKKALAENKREHDAVSLLLYSNEIQQSLRFLNSLNSDIRKERDFQEDINTSIQKKQESIQQNENKINQIQTQISSIQADIDNIGNKISMFQTDREKIKIDISTLKNESEKIEADIETIKSEIIMSESQKERIEFTKLVKEPTVGLAPSGHSRLLIIFIAGLLGLTSFTILAFFLEYINQHRRRTE